MCILLFSNARMTVMQQEMSSDRKEKLERDKDRLFLANKNAKILGDKKYILGMLIAVPART
jgi:hypothetical protein